MQGVVTNLLLTGSDYARAVSSLSLSLPLPFLPFFLICSLLQVYRLSARPGSSSGLGR